MEQGLTREDIKSFKEAIDKTNILLEKLIEISSKDNKSDDRLENINLKDTENDSISTGENAYRLSLIVDIINKSNYRRHILEAISTQGLEDIRDSLSEDDILIPQERGKILNRQGYAYKLSLINDILNTGVNGYTKSGLAQRSIDSLESIRDEVCK